MRSRFLFIWVVAAFAVAALIVAPTAHVAHASPSGIVISAVYPGGGDATGTGNSVLSPYTHDYIEIFNAGAVAVDVSGWSIQYRDAPAASSWEKTSIAPGTILQPGQYYLTQQDPGGDGVGSALPQPDAIGSASMTRAGNLVVALMSTTDTIFGSDPRTDPNTQDDVEDLFGAGDPTNELPSVFEGAVRTGILDNTLAWFRNNAGCQDTGNNLNDFAAGPVAGMARNTATTLAPCAPTADLVVSVTDSPDPVITGNAITYTVDVDNVGSAAANTAVIEVDLSGTAYPGTISGLVAPECSFTHPTITCSVASIASSGSFTFTFQVTPAVTGTVTASAEVSAAAPETTGNNTGAASTTVNDAAPTPADVTVSIAESADPIDEDSPVTYTLTVNNTGTGAATSTTLTVTLGGTAFPGTVTSLTGTGCSFTNPTVNCNIGSLAATSGSSVVSFTVTPTTAGNITVNATVDAADPETDGNNTDSETTTVNAVIPTGATGTIDSTATINSGGNVTVTVVDADLNGAGTVQVTAVGSSGDNETLNLTETGTPGTFSGTFAVASSAATAGNSALEETSGTITFTYIDALDAEGDVNTSLTDTTTVNAAIPTGTTGTIDSTAAITSGDSVTITVVDADLAGAGTVSVTAVGSSGDNETLSLAETGTPGTFSGTFTVANSPANAGNSALEEMSGTITFTYVDALDAEGDVNTSLTDTTTVSAPVPTVGSFNLVSPDEGQILRTTTTTFQWTESAGATSYNVFVSNLSTNTRLGETYTVTKNAGDVCTAGVCSVAGTELVANFEQGTYSWTVIASNGSSEIEAADGPNLFTVVLEGIELVTNGGLEADGTGWTFTVGAKRKCKAAWGDASDCAIKLNPGAKAHQRGLMEPIFAATDTDAGDVLQLSASVFSKKANRQRVMMVVVTYVDPTAGANGNGKDKFRLFIEQATTGYQTFSENFVLDGEVKSGRVVISNTLSSGKLRVDNVSVVLLPIGATPRAAAPASVDGVLPVPAAPDNFRGNN